MTTRVGCRWAQECRCGCLYMYAPIKEADLDWLHGSLKIKKSRLHCLIIMNNASAICLGHELVVLPPLCGSAWWQLIIIITMPLYSFATLTWREKTEWRRPCAKTIWCSRKITTLKKRFFCLKTMIVINSLVKPTLRWTPLIEVTIDRNQKLDVI